MCEPLKLMCLPPSLEEALLGAGITFIPESVFVTAAT